MFLVVETRLSRDSEFLASFSVALTVINVDEVLKEMSVPAKGEGVLNSSKYLKIHIIENN